MKALMKNTGIYKLYYRGSENFYIGSASKSFQLRLNTHLCELRKGTHHNQPLQRGYYKYGEESLVMEPLIICSKDVMRDLEEFAIRCMKPSYNASKSGATRRGVSASKETIEKLSRIHSGKVLSEEHKLNISKGLLAANRKVSDEHKDRLRRLMTGRVVSAETRDKIREHNKGKKQSKETVAKRAKAMRRPVNMDKYLFVHDDGTEVYETLYYMKLTYGLDNHIYSVANGNRSKTKGWSLKTHN
jgi:group I intron endonuclease